MKESRIPENPLAFIKDCMRNGHIYWTYHVNMRMNMRFIPREMILKSIEDFEIIESYPEDKYLPSYLVYSKHENTVFHVIFAADVENSNVRVITAYIPDPGRFDEEMKRRKES